MGIFRFAELELPDSFGDLSDARLKRALQSFLWRMIRPSARIGLPADFELRHLRSDVAILCSWSRSGMVLAYTRERQSQSRSLGKGIQTSRIPKPRSFRSAFGVGEQFRED